VILRAAKVSLVVGVAIFYTFVVLNNLTDYDSNYHSRAVKPRTFRPGIYGPLERGLLLLDVLLNNAEPFDVARGVS